MQRRVAAWQRLKAAESRFCKFGDCEFNMEWFFRIESSDQSYTESSIQGAAWDNEGLLDNSTRI